MSIRVRNVTKRFGDFVALDDVSVDVPSGGLTALLGPSGGGKSTLLRVIAGLEPPDEGSVHIDGAEATHLSPQRRGVGGGFEPGRGRHARAAQRDGPPAERLCPAPIRVGGRGHVRQRPVMPRAVELHREHLGHVGGPVGRRQRGDESPR